MISACMLTIGTIYATHGSDTPAGRWMVIALIYVFIVAFGMSWAVVNRIYCSEIQPMKTRAAATSLGQCANWVCLFHSHCIGLTKQSSPRQIVNWIIAFSTPLFLSRSSSGPYFMFGGFTLLTVLVCVAFQSESQGISLEGLDSTFEVSPWRKILHRHLDRRQRRSSETSA